MSHMETTSVSVLTFEHSLPLNVLNVCPQNTFTLKYCNNLLKGNVDIPGDGCTDGPTSEE